MELWWSLTRSQERFLPILWVKTSGIGRCAMPSVADPDPHVFEPPGSGSFYHHAKMVRKTLIPTILWLFLTVYLCKNDVNVASKSNKQKKLCLKISFLLASWRPMTKIAGSGSNPLVRGMDLRIQIWIRIHKMSKIHNTGYSINVQVLYRTVITYYLFPICFNQSLQTFTSLLNCRYLILLI